MARLFYHRCNNKSSSSSSCYYMRYKRWDFSYPLVIALILSSQQQRNHYVSNALMTIEPSCWKRNNHRIIHHEEHNNFGHIFHRRHHHHRTITTTTSTSSTSKLFVITKNTNTDDDIIINKCINEEEKQQQQQSSSIGKKTKTQYTIDDTVCLPTRPHVLEKAVQKSCLSIDKYLKYKPIAKHTQQAFDSLIDLMKNKTTTTTTSLDPSKKPIILDSGCGTGRSSILLGQMYPDHIVIGIDRSYVRLSKQQGIIGGDGDVDDNDENHDDDDDTSSSSSSSSSSPRGESSSKRPICELMSDNVVLVRAELVDFWRCCYQQQEPEKWNITHHYMLYPNPYPKQTRLTQRWYAHPSFPLLLQLNANEIIIRSNWENYLIEFAKSIEIANEFYYDNDYPSSSSPSLSSTATTTGSGEEEPEQESTLLSTTKNNNNVNNYAEPYLSSAQIGPILRTNKQISMTNFERKYDAIGEPTYQLTLTRES